MAATPATASEAIAAIEKAGDGQGKAGMQRTDRRARAGDLRQMRGVVGAQRRGDAVTTPVHRRLQRQVLVRRDVGDETRVQRLERRRRLASGDRSDSGAG